MNRIRKRIFRVIFGVNTPAGKAFDVILLWAIMISVLMVMLESVPSINTKWATELHIIEWFFTIIFSIEYLARIYSAPNKLRYMLSFYGLVDFLSIIPTYFGLIFPRAQGLAAIRMMRLMRIFRIFKLVRYLKAARTISSALRHSRPKLMVFLLGVMAIVIVMGTLMYLIESESNIGFTSIPRSIYWAIVTLTTVGYGDIAPHTILGQFIASIIMLTGYAIIAVPTGIITAEAMRAQGEMKAHEGRRVCKICKNAANDEDAKYCKNCGQEL